MPEEVGKIKVVLEGEVDEKSLKKSKKRIQDRLKNFGIDVGGISGKIGGKTGALGEGLAGKLGGGEGIAGALGKGGSKLMAVGGAIVAALGLILGALLVIKRIANTSVVYQKVVGNLMKSVKYILRPIGDVIGYALMPIMYVMRMIAKILQAMWRPYRKSISQLMGAGGRYLKAGQTGKATQSWGLALGYMMKPFMDLMIDGLKALMPMLIDVGVDVTKAIVSFGYDVLSKITEVITGVGAWFAEIIDGVFGTSFAPAIREFGVSAQELIAEQKTNMLDAIENVREPMKTGVVDLLDAVKDEYTTAMDDLRDELVEGSKDLVPKELGENIDKQTEGTKSLGEQITEIIATLNSWKLFLEKDFTLTVESTMRDFDRFITTLTNVESNVRNKDIPALNKLCDTLKNTVEDLKKMEENARTTFETLTTQWDEFVWGLWFGLNKLQNAADEFLRVSSLGLHKSRHRPVSMEEYAISDEKAWADYADWLKHVESNTPLNDFIISEGRVYKTNPRDTIVGFKGASPVGGSTVNLSVMLSSQELADKIMDAVKEYINQEVSRKIQGY